jgi:hypothetical protein
LPQTLEPVRQAESVREAYEQLRALADDFEGWCSSAIGADLWIDGVDAVRSTPPRIFDAYLGAFIEFKARLKAQTRGWADELSRFDSFIEALAGRGPAPFLHGLAVGMALIRALGGVPLVAEKGVAVVNDTLLALCSPTYRTIRTAAYNAGIRAYPIDGEGGVEFRPEYSAFALHEPYLIRSLYPIRVQHFNVNHDLAHLAFFADCYIRPIGTEATTASLLLNAEEACCALDLRIVVELSRFDYPLHALEELRRIESGQRKGLESVFAAVAQDPPIARRLERGLKAAAQRTLTQRSGLSRELAQREEPPPELDAWISERARRSHARYSTVLAARIHQPAFSALASLLPPSEDHHRNLIAASSREWDAMFPPEAPEPSLTQRERHVEIHRLRFLVIRVAEVVAAAEREGAAPSAAELDRLELWALDVADAVATAQHGDVGTNVKQLRAAGTQLLAACIGASVDARFARTLIHPADIDDA